MSKLKQQVLIVEDNPADVELMKFVFDKFAKDLNFHYLMSGESFLKHLLSTDERGISLIILDLELPGKTGLEILSYLQAHPNYYDIPVVIFTGSSNEMVRSQCMAHGVKDYVVKSSDLNQYEASLEKMIGQWSLSKPAVQ